MDRSSSFQLPPPPVARTRTRTALAPPSSEPFSQNALKEAQSRRSNSFVRKQTAPTGGDLISSQDTWSMTQEREERYRREIEAQIRAEMAAEEEMRAQIEAELRREAEEEFRKEEQRLRAEMERKLRREMEMEELRTPTAAPPPPVKRGPSKGFKKKGLRKSKRKGHNRNPSVTNSVAELRTVVPPRPRDPKPVQQPHHHHHGRPPIGRRPLPPPPPQPLSPRTVAAIQIQSCTRRWLAKRYMKKLRRRVAAVVEILTTEEQYVTKLKLFQSVFFKALRDSEAQGLINPSDLATVFCNWDDVVIYNTELLRQLRARCDNFRAAKNVGDIFLGMRHFASIYGQFLTAYDGALEVVFWHIKNNPPMAKIIKACEKQLGNTIESYLILPVQRIPRYVLLLRAVVQETETSHPDYALCIQAASKMEEVGTMVNERRREYEAEENRQAILREYDAQIYGCKFRILGDDRGVVQPVSPIVLYDVQEGQKRLRHYIVFSDVFLLLENYKSAGLTRAHRALKYRVVAMFWLKDSQVIDVKDGSHYLGVTAWMSVSLQCGASHLYLFCKTIEEKHQFLECLRNQIEECKKWAQ